MFRPKTILKVISIIMIIFGAFGLIGTAISYIMLPGMQDIPGVDMSIITDTLTPLNLIISVVNGGCCIAAGIFGVSGKSWKWAAITGGIYTLLILISIVQSIVMVGFVWTYVFNLIIPALFWWGLYQSKE